MTTDQLFREEIDAHKKTKRQVSDLIQDRDEWKSRVAGSARDSIATLTAENEALTEQLEQANDKYIRFAAQQFHRLKAVESQLEQYKGLLIEAEGLLCDPCGGVPANALAEKIISHIATPPEQM